MRVKLETHEKLKIHISTPIGLKIGEHDFFVKIVDFEFFMAFRFYLQAKRQFNIFHIGSKTIQMWTIHKKTNAHQIWAT